MTQNLQWGRTYRVTANLEFNYHRPGEGYLFKDKDGDVFALPEEGTVVEEVPWEVLDGDVYLWNGVAYQIHQRQDTGKLDALSVFGGTSDPSDPEKFGFTKEHLIYRKEIE